MRRKIILTAICLSLSVAFFPVIALGSEDAISELNDQLSQRFPGLEEVRNSFGDRAKWQSSTFPNPHDDNIELVLDTMEHPGIEIRTVRYTYENEERFFLTLVRVKAADIVDFLGIDVGSARADVIKRFGEPPRSEGNKLIYENESGYTEIVFTVEGNKIAEMAFNNYLD
jgi:hypothetical protein